MLNQRFRHYLYLFIIVGFLHGNLNAQTCPNPGQNPLTPFPACGNLIFAQSSVPACNGMQMVTRCSGDGVIYKDINPYYYQFTCFQSGLFSFTITPNDLSDDYDWQLFDITGVDPLRIYTDPTLIVSGNWSGSSGITGASPSALNNNECASVPSQNISTFSKSPNLIQGHIYLLMVSHFTATNQSGYKLNLAGAGGTAVITDPLLPIISSATFSCNNTQIGLKFNKSVQCSSIAIDGSDFVISGPTTLTILSATGFNCSGDFDTDSVIVTFSGKISNGAYTVAAKKGTDGNSVLDFCLNAVNTTNAVTILPTPIAQIQAFTASICSGIQFSVVPSENSTNIVPAGTLYTWTFPSGIQINGGADQVVPLSAISGKLSLVGTTPQIATYSVTPSNGGCNAKPFTLSLTVYPQPQIVITASDQQLCLGSIIQFFGTANGMGFPVNQWMWKISDEGASSLQNPVWLFKKTGVQRVTSYIFNEKGCSSDTAKIDIPVFPKPQLQLTNLVDVDWGDSIQLIPKLVSGQNLSYKWTPGLYLSSDTVVSPFARPFEDITYQLKIIGDGFCLASDTVHVNVRKLPEIPNIFSPNGDGIHDTWQIRYLQDYPNSSVQLFSRTGQLVYSSTASGLPWDGTYDGKPVPVATYYYVIKLNNGKPPLSGSVIVIR